MNPFVDVAGSDDPTAQQPALPPAGTDVNLAGDDGVTPLLAALQAGQFYTAAHLLEQGAAATAITHDGRTAMHALLHHLRQVPPDWTDAGRTEPAATIHAQALWITRLLLGLGVRIEQARRPGGERALHDALEVSARIADALLGYGAMFHAPDSEGSTALHRAARLDRGTFLASIQGTIDVDLADARGLTPLHEAILAGHVQLARTLVADFACDPRKPTTVALPGIPTGSDAIAMARRLGHPELADWLARAAPVNGRRCWRSDR